MSLILQALKKAEAERALGRAPTLDRVAAAEPEAAPRRGGSVAGVAIAALAALALGVWWGFDRDRPAPPGPAASGVIAAAAPVPMVAPPASVQPVQPAASATFQPPPAVLPTQRAASAPSLAPRSIPAPPAAAPPTIHELPVTLRQALPPLPVTGSIWSARPAERMLILAGEIRREGDRITPELELVSIGQRAALLRFRDQAFRLPY